MSPPKLSERKIRQYAMAYEAGDDFPAIEADDCGNFYTIRDGRHRYAAQRRSGYATIPIITRPS